MPRGKASSFSCLASNSSSRSVPLHHCCRPVRPGCTQPFFVSKEDMRVLELVSQPAEQKASPRITLSPSQRKAADCVCLGLKRGECAVLQDHGSSGKTTVLGYVQEQLGRSRMAILTASSSRSSRC